LESKGKVSGSGEVVSGKEGFYAKTQAGSRQRTLRTIKVHAKTQIGKDAKKGGVIAKRVCALDSPLYRRGAGGEVTTH